MSPIALADVRPPLWPNAASAPVNRGTAPAGGQRAFFDAAMGRAGAGPSAPQAAAPVAPVQTQAQAYPQRMPTAAPQPDADGQVKYRRPGSILDIRV
ncbi:MAG: hypothetical protein JWP35_3016 [Caulobacter sp.]|nr:hypothetical protein [Caulobacter sp.]